jgi:hypothetical protein
MDNIVEEIEAKYPVDRILVDREQVWPYLRIFYHLEYVTKIWGQNGETQYGEPLYPQPSVSQRLKVYLEVVKNSSYGLKNWLGKYDYVALSNTQERRSINGKYFNRLIDTMIDELGRDSVLYIERRAPSFYPIKKVHTKRVVGRDLIDLIMLLVAFWEKITLRRYTIQNRYILQAIQRDYNLEIDDAQLIKTYIIQRRVYSLLFRMIKPKAILLSDYYSANMPAIKAARNLGIKVVEFQHGLIGNENPAYNVGVEIDKTYFPDYLLVFGRKEIETFANSRFIEPKNVFPVGSFYIEHMRSNRPECSLAKRLENYKRSVGITLSWTDEKSSIAFVRQAANLDKRIFYILIPRRPTLVYYDTLNLPENVAIIKDMNFYEVITYVDFHSTVSSTCAIEAPSLGVQNILIDIDGVSKRFFGNILNDSRITRYINTPKEFVNTINTFEKLSKDTISKLNEDIIATDYKKNIRDFINLHLKQ